MKKIERVRLFSNNNDKSRNIYDITYNKLTSNGFSVVEDNFDLAIAIGGDGAFLRMVKSCNFNSDILYVGINSGTLGFAQEVAVEELDSFIEELKDNNYKVDEIGVEEVKVFTDNEEVNFYSLNEIVIRQKELNVAMLDISIDDVFLEKFVGDGILVSTSFGTTAYNLSFGGSIIFNTFHSLQITPIAPLHNKVFKSLTNSIVIPEKKVIKIVPSIDKNDLLITVDGENKIFDNVVLIESSVDCKRIKCLRRLDYDFFEKVNEKFLR